MKFLAFFLLQGLHKKPDNKSYFSKRKILETLIFLNLYSERRFLKFLHSADKEKGQCHETRFNCENFRVALCAAPFPMLSQGG
jgi:hypothetical protein